jgi:hypothetical protein
VTQVILKRINPLKKIVVRPLHSHVFIILGTRLTCRGCGGSHHRPTLNNLLNHRQPLVNRIL